MTNHPHPSDEPATPAVRSMLWRLRARLVTPPAEDRAAADLDRILHAARAHAHDEPSVGGATQGADARSDQHVQAGDDTSSVTPIGAAPSRRHAAVAMVGRVAAAAVLVAAVGGGIATARDGQFTIDALFGRSGEPVPEDDGLAIDDPIEIEGDQDGEVAPPDLDDADAERDERRPPGLDELDLDDPDDLIDEPEPEPEPEGSTGDGSDTAGGSGGSSSDSGSSTGESSGSSGSSGSDGSSGNGGSSGTGSNGSSDGSSDDGSEDGTSGDGSNGGEEQPADDGDVIAAPPSDLDGFGGPKPCPEDVSLDDCLRDRDGEGDGSEEDDGSDGSDGSNGDDGDQDDTDEDDTDDGEDPDDDGDDETSEKDDLKSRRGGN